MSSAQSPSPSASHPTSLPHPAPPSLRLLVPRSPRVTSWDLSAELAHSLRQLLLPKLPFCGFWKSGPAFPAPPPRPRGCSRSAPSRPSSPAHPSQAHPSPTVSRSHTDILVPLTVPHHQSFLSPFTDFTPSGLFAQGPVPGDPGTTLGLWGSASTQSQVCV